MSSMRNAVARRPHKERSQPLSRQKWGLLEKHKDYSLRAKDFNKKKEKLAILSQKSRDKHPDEFAFGMLSKSSSTRGKHGQRGDENKLSHDAVQLLKTQDAGYLRTVAQRNRREIERVQEEVGLDTVTRRPSTRNNTTVFDEDGEPLRKKQRAYSTRQSLEPLDDETLNVMNATTISEIVDGTQEIEEVISVQQTKSKKQLDKEEERSRQLKLARRKRQRLEELRKAKLEILRKRQKEIFAAADALELQRAKMANVVGGTNKNGVKFKVRERKR